MTRNSRYFAIVVAWTLILVGVLTGGGLPVAATPTAETYDCSANRTITAEVGSTIRLTVTGCAGRYMRTDGSATLNDVSGTSASDPWVVDVTLVAAGTSALVFNTPFVVLTLDVMGPLEPPTSVTGAAASGAVDLWWTFPSSTGAGLSFFEVQYSSDNGGTWSAPVATSSAATTSQASPFRVSGLANGTSYVFQVRSIEIDTSRASAWSSSSATVTPSLPPPSPTSVTGAAKQLGVELAWTAPVIDSTYAPITGYRIQVSTDESTWFDAANDPNTTTSPAIVTNWIDANLNQQSLRAGTPYYLRVAAVNSVGDGSFGVLAGAVTPFDVPGPVDLDFTMTATATQTDEQTLALSWPAPASNGLAIMGYEVEYSTSPMGPYGPPPTGSTCSGNVATTSCSVTGLSPGDHYFQVRGINAAGPGQWGQHFMPVVLLGPAGPPLNVSVVASDQVLTVEWQPPTSWGGVSSFQVCGQASEVSYDIEVATSGIATWTRSSVSVQCVGPPPPSFQPPSPVASGPRTISGLANGTSYDIRVRAVTSYGGGDWATVSGAVPSTTPGQVPAPMATRGDTEVLLSWTAPVSDGGSVITDYEYEVSSDGGNSYAAPVAVGSASTSVTVTGLTNGTTYVFRVAARNANGLGATSLASNAATPVALPGTPSGLSATSASGSVTLTWTPGTSVGASLAGHLVELSIDGGTTWTAAIADTGSASGTATVTGLSNGTAYRFRVSGISAAGTGLPLALASSVTPSTTPSAVTGLAAQVGDQQVALTWSAGADGGTAITGYRIERNDGTGWTIVTADTGSASTSAVVTGLTNGTPYDFRVTPINARGASAAVAPGLATPVRPVAAPGVPPAPTAVAGPGSATVTVVAGSGGTPSRFTVTAVDSSSQAVGTCTVSGGTGSCTITGLTAGASYTFTATATNANTTSAASAASASVTPLAVASGGSTGGSTGNGTGGSVGGAGTPGAAAGTASSGLQGASQGRAPSRVPPAAPMSPGGAGTPGGSGGATGQGSSTPGSTTRPLLPAPPPVAITLPPVVRDQAGGPIVSSGTAVGTNTIAGGAIVDGRPSTTDVVTVPGVLGTTPNGATLSGRSGASGSSSSGQYSVTVMGPRIAGPVGGGLQVVLGRPLSLGVTGFAPNAEVTVFAMPSRLMVGTLATTPRGTFDGAVEVPLTVPPGSDALQLAGTAADGSTLHLALGVVVQPPAVPAVDSAGALPEPASSGIFVLVDQTPVPTEPTRDGGRLSVAERGATVQVSSRTGEGDTAALTSDGTLVVSPQGAVELAGTGMSGFVDVFVFSTPVYVGRVMVAEDGTFTGVLPLPDGIAPGDHTLQLVGISPIGEEIAVSLPLRQVDRSEDIVTIELAGGRSAAQRPDGGLLIGLAVALVTLVSIRWLLEARRRRDDRDVESPDDAGQARG